MINLINPPGDYYLFQSPPLPSLKNQSVVIKSRPTFFQNIIAATNFDYPTLSNTHFTTSHRTPFVLTTLCNSPQQMSSEAIPTQYPTQYSENAAPDPTQITFQLTKPFLFNFNPSFAPYHFGPQISPLTTFLHYGTASNPAYYNPVIGLMSLFENRDHTYSLFNHILSTFRLFIQLHPLPHKWKAELQRTSREKELMRHFSLFDSDQVVSSQMSGKPPKSKKKAKTQRISAELGDVVSTIAPLPPPPPLPSQQFNQSAAQPYSHQPPFQNAPNNQGSHVHYQNQQQPQFQQQQNNQYSQSGTYHSSNSTHYHNPNGQTQCNQNYNGGQYNPNFHQNFNQTNQMNTPSFPDQHNYQSSFNNQYAMNQSYQHSNHNFQHPQNYQQNQHPYQNHHQSMSQHSPNYDTSSTGTIFNNQHNLNNFDNHINPPLPPPPPPHFQQPSIQMSVQTAAAVATTTTTATPLNPSAPPFYPTPTSPPQPVEPTQEAPHPQQDQDLPRFGAEVFPRGVIITERLPRVDAQHGASFIVGVPPKWTSKPPRYVFLLQFLATLHMVMQNEYLKSILKGKVEHQGDECWVTSWLTDKASITTKQTADALKREEILKAAVSTPGTDDKRTADQTQTSTYFPSELFL